MMPQKTSVTTSKWTPDIIQEVLSKTDQGEVLETDTGAVFYRTKSKETLTTISDSLRAHYGKNVFSYPKMQQINNMLYSDIMDWAYARYEGTTRSFKLREWSTKTCYWNTHLPSGFILHVAAKSSTSSDHTQSLLRLLNTRPPVQRGGHGTLSMLAAVAVAEDAAY